MIQVICRGNVVLGRPSCFVNYVRKPTDPMLTAVISIAWKHFMSTNICTCDQRK